MENNENMMAVTFIENNPSTGNSVKVAEETYYEFASRAGHREYHRGHFASLEMAEMYEDRYEGQEDDVAIYSMTRKLTVWTDKDGKRTVISDERTSHIAKLLQKKEVSASPTCEQLEQLSEATASHPPVDELAKCFGVEED